MLDMVYAHDDGTNVRGCKDDEPEPMLLECIALNLLLCHGDPG